MKKIFNLLLAVLVAIIFSCPVYAGQSDRFSGIDLTKGNYVQFPAISAPSGNPKTNYGWLYVKDTGTMSLYFEDDAGTVTNLLTSTGNTLNAAYNQGGAGAGRTITVDQGAVELDGSHATNNTFFINKTAGSGHGIQITNAGTGYDINGTSGTWFVTKVGLATVAGLTSTGVINLSGGVLSGASPLVFEGNTADSYETTLAVTDPTADQTITIPNATGTVRILATASHNYGAAHADWTLSATEQAASFISVTNADAGANILLPAALPGATWTIYNNSGQTITFKVSGQTGGTIANGKRAFYTCDAVDVYEIWEQS